MPDDSTFGARLALVRQFMKWGNVKEAAVACGLPVESWRTWERDNVLPRRYTAICVTIADKTGCDLGWLLAGGQLREGVRIVPAITEVHKQDAVTPKRTTRDTPGISRSAEHRHGPTGPRPSRASQTAGPALTRPRIHARLNGPSAGGGRDR